MNVKIYDINQDTGEQTFRAVAYLADAMASDDDEYSAARAELQRSGRYWVGGGAAPLVLLMRTTQTID